jgi:hypothetical protein
MKEAVGRQTARRLRQPILDRNLTHLAASDRHAEYPIKRFATKTGTIS